MGQKADVLAHACNPSWEAEAQDQKEVQGDPWYAVFEGGVDYTGPSLKYISPKPKHQTNPSVTSCCLREKSKPAEGRRLAGSGPCALGTLWEPFLYGFSAVGHLVSPWAGGAVLLSVLVASGPLCTS